jgi:hypothetical protein
MSGKILMKRRGTIGSNLGCSLASGRLGMTPAGGEAPVGGAAGPAVVAHRSWAYAALSTSVFDEDFTYGMGATWRT